MAASDTAGSITYYELLGVDKDATEKEVLEDF